MSSSSNSPSLSPRRLRPPLSSSSRDVLEVDDGLISIEEHDALDVHQAEDKRKKKKSKKKSKKSSKRDLIHGVSSSSIDEDGGGGGGGGDYAYEDDEEEEEDDHDGEEESVDASSVPNYVADGLWIQKKSSSSRSISSSSKKKKKKKKLSSSSTSSRSLGRSSRSLRSVASSEDGSYLEDSIVGGEDGSKRKKKKKSHKRESSSSSSSSKRHREPTSLMVGFQANNSSKHKRGGGGDGIWVNPTTGNDIRRNAEEQLAFLQSSTDLVDQHMERSHQGTTTTTPTTTVPKRDSFMWQSRGNVALATNVWYRRVMSHLCYGTGKRKYWIVGTVFLVSLILTFVLVGSLANRRFQITTLSPTTAPTDMPSNAPSGSSPGEPLSSSAPTNTDSSSSVVAFQGRDCPTSPIYGPLRCAYNEFCVLCPNINELYLCWNQPQPLNRVQFQDACTATMQQGGHPCNPGAAPCPFGNLCVPCNSFAPLDAMTGRVCLAPQDFTRQRRRNLRQPPLEQEQTGKRRLQGDIFDPPTNPPNTPSVVVTAAPVATPIPTVVATTVMPVAAIITAQPTTAQPTATTLATDTPATPQPTMAPTTPKPTVVVSSAPITPQPTMATTTMSPTLQETTTPTAYSRCMTGQP